MDDIHSQLIALRTSVSGPALFCMHDGVFGQLAAHLPANTSIYELRPLNLNAPGPDLSVERLAESHLRRVLEVEDRGPYHLVGYSFGGLVAYEMARLLESHGHEIALLGLIDTPHPRFSKTLSSSELAAARKTYLADRWRKYGTSLTHARFNRLAADAGKLAAKKIQRLAWWMMSAVNRTTGIGRAHISMAHRIESMWRAYVPRTFAGRLVLFRAEGRGAEFGDDPTMGWRRSVLNGVDVQFARGAHESMLDAPYAEHLARQLLPYLSIARS